MTASAQSPITVRAAGAGDLAAVAALLRAAKLPVDGLTEQFGPAYAVAEVNSQIIGAEGIERYGDAGLLRSAVVSAEHRGTGVGDRLTTNRIAWAKSQGVREVWLLTTTAQEYFPRFGFAVADRNAAPDQLKQSVEFREACPASAVAMKLDLT